MSSRHLLGLLVPRATSSQPDGCFTRCGTSPRGHTQAGPTAVSAAPAACAFLGLGSASSHTGCLLPNQRSAALSSPRRGLRENTGPACLNDAFPGQAACAASLCSCLAQQSVACPCPTEGAHGDHGQVVPAAEGGPRAPVPRLFPERGFPGRLPSGCSLHHAGHAGQFPLLGRTSPPRPPATGQSP